MITRESRAFRVSETVDLRPGSVINAAEPIRTRVRGEARFPRDRSRLTRVDVETSRWHLSIKRANGERSTPLDFRIRWKAEAFCSLVDSDATRGADQTHTSRRRAVTIYDTALIYRRDLGSLN